MNSPAEGPRSGNTWYFAYGSNLSTQRMTRRTGDGSAGRVACLKDYRFAFNNSIDGAIYANIVPSAGSLVWGVVYSCDREAMIELDHYEGVAEGYYRRKLVAVETVEGQRLEAETYVSGEKRPLADGIPELSYLNVVLSGAGEHRLPERYIAAIEALGRPSSS